MSSIEASCVYDRTYIAEVPVFTGLVDILPALKREAFASNFP
jgi:hypothetical protein